MMKQKGRGLISSRVMATIDIEGRSGIYHPSSGLVGYYTISFHHLGDMLRLLAEYKRLFGVMDLLLLLAVVIYIYGRALFILLPSRSTLPGNAFRVILIPAGGLF